MSVTFTDVQYTGTQQQINQIKAAIENYVSVGKKRQLLINNTEQY